MTLLSWLRRSRYASRSAGRLLADGSGEDDAVKESDGAAEESDGAAEESDGADGGDEPDSGDSGTNDGRDQSSVEVTPAGEVDPADPKWEKPDLDDIPEVEGPKTAPADESTGTGARSEADETSGAGAPSDDTPSADGVSGGKPAGSDAAAEDPTTGMPNTARSPGTAGVDEEATEAYVLAVELCAQLPDDVRLPEEAADLVPAAVEAELEREVQTFAAQEFGNQQPHVSELSFTESDDEIWLRLRIGAPPEAFDDLADWKDDIELYALQKLDSLL